MNHEIPYKCTSQTYHKAPHIQIVTYTEKSELNLVDDKTTFLQYNTELFCEKI